MRCNQDCLNCTYYYCVLDDNDSEDIELTEQELADSKKRDRFANLTFNCKYDTYDHTPKGKARYIRFWASQKGKDLASKYNNSEKGKERFSKYNNSEKGKEARKRYAQSEKGRLNQIRKNERRKEQRRLAHVNLQTNC